MSRSGEFALYAFTYDHDIGVDIERIRPLPDMDRLAKNYFSAGEYHRLRTLPAKVRTKAFYHCWTRKEAFLKARGDGLGFGLDRFEVTLAPGEPAALLTLDNDPGEAAGWSFWDVETGTDTVAALALRRTGDY
jgi:4'-phosphopantetheinyl transferase